MNNNSNSGALIALICLTVFGVTFIIYTTRYLPETVATHFSAGRHADGWMTRNEYLAFMLAFLIGVPGLVSFVIGALPRKYPQWTNVPIAIIGSPAPIGKNRCCFCRPTA